MELAHDRVKWRAVVLNVFNLGVLLPRIYDPPAAVFIAVYQVQVRPNGVWWNGLSSYTININTADSVYCQGNKTLVSRSTATFMNIL